MERMYDAWGRFPRFFWEYVPRWYEPMSITSRSDTLDEIEKTSRAGAGATRRRKNGDFGRDACRNRWDLIARASNQVLSAGTKSPKSPKSPTLPQAASASAGR